MHKQGRVFGTLRRYFFRRFFENDLLEASGDTTSTIARALAIVAAPGLMFAFWMQNQYPQRSAWGRIEDHYFFVLYSFLAMAGVAIFEWDMLFPDRLDFLVLSPLPLRQHQLLGAKAVALAAFLAIFLLGANVFGWFLLCLVSKDHFGRQLWAHALAVLCRGAFAAFAVLAAGGVLLCVLPARMFRVISPVLQMMSVAALGLLLFHYLRFGDVLQESLTSPQGGVAKLVPTFWFLGLYEYVLRGKAAAPFARSMMQVAVFASVVSVLLVLVTYPLAWLRVQRMAVEGEAGLRGRPAFPINGCMARVIQAAARRAVVHFIGQTMARNNRYQVYLAMYCGVGLALATACAVTFVSRGTGLQAMLSPIGLRAVVPLLLFWAIAGLRMAFALPLNLPARWVFRITGAARRTCISGGRVWALLCSVMFLAMLLPLLWWAGLQGRALLVQTVCGICLCSIMVDSMMFADRGIPFAQPRSPGKTSLPLMLTLFIGVLPVFCLGMVRLEKWFEENPSYLIAGVLIVPAVHYLVAALRLRSQPDLGGWRRD